jgi:FAD/FMN-containing dehydrogenase/Fe-S oxidoreductase
MLPRITPDATLNLTYHKYLDELRQTPFAGEICIDYATRLTLATDNSIYQIIPQAVIFPRSTQDVVYALKLAHQEKFHDIKFCPRGGGTSTNGQSVSEGIILDCSKYLCECYEVNVPEQWVHVQSGIVLDQLNAYLKTFGMSFAPEISPSNRATIGGMINTDACGIGSKVLGRTSEHVIELTAVLSNGEIINTTDPLLFEDKLISFLKPHKKLIAEKFGTAPRTLNGYNLKKAYEEQLNLNYLFCGSEGTLAVVTECKLKLTPIPKYKKLVVVKYRNFDDALRDHDIMDKFQPLVIEAIDEKLVELARHDSIYFYIKDFIDGNNEKAGAINLVEFVSEDAEKITAQINHFCKCINENKQNTHAALGCYVAKDSVEAKQLWDLRKKSVGLISKKIVGTRRPIPFVEDTAVPPEYLADYIQEFRTLLDKHDLTYGMYGHVDAGCVHVRPALDMKKTADKKLMKQISDELVVLLKKYGGVLWGEHGQGRRCVYAEDFFGGTLYNVVRQIKTLFDPHNQLNPGKIAVANNTTQLLATIEGPLRGEFDRQIPRDIQESYSSALICNGNGACFNYATNDPMCPSFKATQNRIHSPKGRASLMKEWLRQLAILKIDVAQLKPQNVFKKIKNQWNKKDFSHQVQEAMNGCLSCKACVAQCPLNVDVPDLKSRFLFYYHQRYLRKWRDYLLINLEKLAPWQARFSKINNMLLKMRWMKWIIKKVFALVDAPLVSAISLKKSLAKRKAPAFDFKALHQLSNAQKEKSIIILQDVFTSFYETRIVLAFYDLLNLLGYTVYIAPFFENGKALQVKGFLTQFERLVRKNQNYLKELSALNIPLIGVDPVPTLTYRDEYRKIIGKTNVNVFLIQEWLSQHCSPGELANPGPSSTHNYYLVSHCTEKTQCIESEKLWQQIFATFNASLTPLPAGCCGMAGIYGHELEHLETSKKLFDMDWKQYIADNPHTLLATGYSCRSQSQRFAKTTLRHPVEVLVDILKRKA